MMNYTFYKTILSLIVLLYCGSLTAINKEPINEQQVKIALRGTGHQLLLSNSDSTSLVLPVKKVNELKYRLTFENELSFHPDDLVVSLQENLQKLSLPSQYRVEVIDSHTQEVVYSYEISMDKEKTIIPCSGRHIPKKSYFIELTFIKEKASVEDTTVADKDESSSRRYLPFLTLFGLLFFVIYNARKKRTVKTNQLEQQEDKAIAIGQFQFFPNQNKLVKSAVETHLSKKECELLGIFVTHINEVVKREDLMKQVWEDKGVVVGRSLDTYVSKLRKILKEDDSLQIKNIHGVGYKLEMK